MKFPLSINLLACLFSLALATACGRLPDSSSPAELVSSGIAAYQAGDYERAHAAWKHAANDGNTEAVYYLGVLTNEGRIGNSADALELFRQAAAQGHAKAQYNLALAYERGMGVIRNRGEALLWLNKAAAQGDADSQYMLGLLLFEGIDGSKPGDAAAALEWLEQSAAQGNVKAQYQLGVIYLDRRLGAVAPGKALHWLGKALQGGEIMALRPMLEAKRLAAGDSGQRDLASLEREASAGDPAARHELATRLFLGNGVEQDRPRSIVLLQDAATAGHADSQYDLGMSLIRSDVPDIEAGLGWLEKAAAQGHAEAQYALGQSLAEGWAGDPDDGKAVERFRKAADQGLPKAEYAVGYAYSEGAGAPRDDSLAVSWFRKAASHGYPEAAFRISTMYAEGEGVRKDPQEQRRWECRGMVLGSTRARESLQARGGFETACAAFRDDIVAFAMNVLGDPTGRQ